VETGNSPCSDIGVFSKGIVPAKRSQTINGIVVLYAQRKTRHAVVLTSGDVLESAPSAKENMVTTRQIANGTLTYSHG